VSNKNAELTISRQY